MGIPSLGPSAANGYSGMHWLRFSMVALALLNASAHLFASPGATPQVTFWLESEVAVYVLVAVIYLLGLRMWYVPAVLYTVLNLVFFFLSAYVPIPGVTNGALVGHVEFAKYSFGRGFSLLSWMYLLAVGLLLIRIDRGSKINDLLKDS